jgi:hypothetical protein
VANDPTEPTGWSKWKIHFLVLVLFVATVFALLGNASLSLRLAGLLAAIALFFGVMGEAPRAAKAAPSRIEIDGEGVRRLQGSKLIEAVRWEDLIKVSIVTTDEGPFVEDLFWLLHSKDGRGCVVPHADAVEANLLARLQRLPRFDNEAVISASGSTQGAEFTCWVGTTGEGIVANGKEDGKSATQ